MRLLLATIVAVSLSAPATAQTAAERQAHAVQCLLAMSAANGAATDATAEGAAKIGMLFFAGEVFGMDPNVDLTAAARAQLPGLSRSKLQSLIPLCGAEMHARQRQISAIGPALSQGRQAPPPTKGE